MPELITILIVVTCLFLILVELLRNKLSTIKAYPDKEQISEKTRLTALLLCLIFGPLGIHRFYMGRAGSACLMICTLGCLGLWTMLDVLFIIMGRFTDIEGKQVFNWTENKIFIEEKNMTVIFEKSEINEIEKLDQKTMIPKVVKF